jgi:hypothetical protein
MEDTVAGLADAKTTASESTSTHAGQSSQDEDPRPVEIGGPPGPEPTRYGDWEKKGRCIDF